MAGDNILAKDIGGLPVGVWALVVIGGVAVGWFLLRPKTTNAPATTGTTGAQNIPQEPVIGPTGPPGPPGDPGAPGPQGPPGAPAPPVTFNPNQFYTLQASDIVGAPTFQLLSQRFGISLNQFLAWNCVTYPAICAGLKAQPGWVVRIA